jgi:hypothetical protein
MRKVFLLVSALAALFAVCAYGQDDSPSLGDVARQTRQQKQQKEAQAKDAQGKDKQGKDTLGKGAQAPKTPKVVTNDEIPEHTPSALPHNPDQPQVVSYYPQQPSGGWKPSADQWKNQILQMKNYIASLQAQIDQLNDSIHFASGNCVSGCVQWNERQREKQQQVEQMKTQLEDQKKRLEDMQETARQQGYGSSVYDP